MGFEIKARRGPSGRMSEVVFSTLRSMRPTQGDLVAGALFLRTKILQQTAAGRDLNGAPFASYSQTGPIYIDVGARSGGGAGGVRTAEQRISSARRFLRSVGRKSSVFKRTTTTTRKRTATKRSDKPREPARFRLIRGVTEFGQITPGGFLKLRSYAEFKLSFLGRATVDLLGHRAPHMLQQLIVRFGGSQSVAPTVDLNAFPGPPRPVSLGWLGEAAGIALAHNTGAGNLPKRKFFGITAELGRLVAGVMARRSVDRGQKASKGVA